MVTLNRALNARLWQYPHWSFTKDQELEPIPSVLEADRLCCEEYEVNIGALPHLSGSYVRHEQNAFGEYKWTMDHDKHYRLGGTNCNGVLYWGLSLCTTYDGLIGTYTYCTTEIRAWKIRYRFLVCKLFYVKYVPSKLLCLATLENNFWK